MTSFDNSQLLLILPEIILLSGVSFILVMNLFLRKEHEIVGYFASQLLLIITLIANFSLLGTHEYAFSGSIIIDELAIFTKGFILVFAIVLLQYIKEFFIKYDDYKNEYFSLAMLSILGMMIMSSGSNLISLYLGLEIMSLSLYSMIATANKKVLAIEAALKYFILGAISSGILLYGMSLLYGATGSLDITTIAANAEGANQLLLNFATVFIIIGLAFKFGAVPFHMWVPDVYQGANLATTMFLSSIPKLATSIMFIRIVTTGLESSVEYWSQIVMFLGMFSVVVGTLVALAQASIKRLLAYSTIAHIGFVLVAFSLGNIEGYSAAVYYTAIYILTAVAAFGILISLSHKSYDITNINDIAGVGKAYPLLAFLMLIVMFSMAGIPPTVGFYAKLSILLEVVQNSHIIIATILVIFAVIGAYYYLKVIKVMFFDKPQQEGIVIIADNQLGTNLSLIANVGLILAMGFFPNYFISLINVLF